ncbi:MAG TPA: TIGR01777 family oxidoreductase [Acidimicrobiales bacterium]|nr:TIGR01777 family oxidoreductase [Acidimicrobiales bacterium]
MNLLVTGSSGLIGSALLERWLAGGHQATRLVRGTTPHTTEPTSRPTRPPGGRGAITDVHWDPSQPVIDLDGLEAAGPFDGVVHLAGAGIGDKRWSPARKQIVLDSRTDSTGLLVTSLLQLAPRPPVLISASAVGFYGEGNDRELTEEAPQGRGILAELCGSWERAAAPAAEAGIRTVNLRSGIVLDASGGALAKMLPIFKLCLGGKLGSGTQYQSWIALVDEVDIILRALVDGSVVGPVNATAPNPVTNAELSMAIARAVHRPCFLSVPGAALRLALGSEMANELLLTGQRALPTRMTSIGYSFSFPDLDNALRHIVTG